MDRTMPQIPPFANDEELLVGKHRKSSYFYSYLLQKITNSTYCGIR